MTSGKQRNKKCLRCGEIKPREEFVRDKLRSGGIFPWCKECHCQYQKLYRENNREHYLALKRQGSRDRTALRQAKLNRRCPVCDGPVIGRINKVFCNPKCGDKYERLDMYGLKPAEFRKLIESGLCPLCGCKVKKWEIDHDHSTGETMGPVCSRCNQYLLAGSKHDVAIAKRLVDFLTCSPVRKLLGERRYQGLPRMSNWHRIWLWTGELPKDRTEIDEATAMDRLKKEAA